MAILVLQSWKVNQKPDEENNYVSITGRHEGLISWLLTIWGICPSTVMKVGADRVEWVASSISGTDRRIILLENVSSTYFGYYKPIWKAIALFVTLVIMSYALIRSLEDFVAPRFVIGLVLVVCLIIIIVVPIVYYNLNRVFTLGVVELSGIVNGIAFKRSVIEGEDIQEDNAAYAGNLIQALIEAKHQRYMSSH